ncbi:hypothetical protein SADUNF_Sadunf18G0008000 [Salix dunnii]|uniref:Sugar phosphate transporter domain-containing protein n=1 Tax=Salix dunnii TaxID=1413687 RepID=A0A835MLP0_9ROSI|nr:hypothetical protein SADUNF_Sadunf18G0008000 [Salix dunnii]
MVRRQRRWWRWRLGFGFGSHFVEFDDECVESFDFVEVLRSFVCVKMFVVGVGVILLLKLMRGRYSRGKMVMLVKEEELWKNCGLLYSANFTSLKAQSSMNNGSALEELRSSLFSRFRFSESSKQHEQRSCGPFIALTFIHYTLSWALMAILKAFSVLPASPSSKSSRLSLFTLGFVMSLSTGLANVSLKYSSVGFYQMAKIAVTPSIVLAEFIWFKKRASFSKVVTLSVVSIGVAAATVTNLQFSLFGACVSLAWIIPSAVIKILWSTLPQQDNWTALVLMWKTAPITLLFLATLIPFFDPSGVFSYDWNFRNTALILTSALLGFLLQWSGALALGFLNVEMIACQQMDN